MYELESIQFQKSMLNFSSAIVKHPTDRKISSYHKKAKKKKYRNIEQMSCKSKILT